MLPESYKSDCDKPKFTQKSSPESFRAAIFIRDLFLQIYTSENERPYFFSVAGIDRISLFE